MIGGSRRVCCEPTALIVWTERTWLSSLTACTLSRTKCTFWALQETRSVTLPPFAHHSLMESLDSFILSFDRSLAEQWVVADFACFLFIDGTRTFFLNWQFQEKALVLNPASVVATELMNLYEAMGDCLAYQYGGSEAHSKFFKRQKGSWEVTTQSKDMMTRSVSSSSLSPLSLSHQPSSSPSSVPATTHD